MIITALKVIITDKEGKNVERKMVKQESNSNYNKKGFKVIGKGKKPGFRQTQIRRIQMSRSNAVR